MKTYKLYLFGLILAGFLPFFSCADERDSIETSSSDNQVLLKLSLPQTTFSVLGTEAGEATLNENTITNLNVFIYRNDEDACVFYEQITPRTPVTDGIYSTYLDITQESFLFNVLYDVYVVANYTGTIDPAGIPLTILKGLTTGSLNPDKIQDNFIMDGVVSMILSDGILADKEIEVNLRRAAAKIRVALEYKNGLSLANGQQVTKEIINYTSDTPLLQNGDEVTPTLAQMTSFTNQNSGAGNNDHIIVYSYENDWNEEMDRETYLVINVPVRDDQGSTHIQNYYKVPVNYRYYHDNDKTPLTGEEEEYKKSLYKIERNHLYDVTVSVDKLGSTNPFTPVDLRTNYTIKNWTTQEIEVSIENFNYLYVEDKEIEMPNISTYTTTFQSSTPDVQITDIKVEGVNYTNGSGNVTIAWTQNVKSGNITIKSTIPDYFAPKTITFKVKNGAGLEQDVSVEQYPPLYISSHLSADEPQGGQGQNNRNMYTITSLVGNYSMLPNPDEFDENFGSGYSHYAPNPALGASYAQYLREYLILGFPLLDTNGYTIDSDENNRRISPSVMLASQHGTTGAADYLTSRTKCANYVERDADTGLTYSDWRMPTLAELYMIDVLQNIRLSKVKRILEGHYYWSADASSAVTFMDPRVGSESSWTSYNAAVRCVRDMK